MSDNKSFVIGCVGKPSSGKSTFFNAVSSTPNAKVGAYPFTTINPNQGIGYCVVDCPCVKYNVASCEPRYGICRNGKRSVPVKILDVAGLIPGASQGLGLGNKFLDDLRHADVLLHILDVSGTTNEKGEAAKNYDPSKDHNWLLQEIELWVFNNLWERWKTVARRHVMTHSTVTMTLSQQFSGYGAKPKSIRDVIDDLEVPDSGTDLTTWTKDQVMHLVSVFVKHRFRFILVLNKADLINEDTNKNILKMFEKFGSSPIILASALSECFLRKMVEKKYIEYYQGDSIFYTAEDRINSELKRPDEKLKMQLEKIRDMILYRLGSTGVLEAIQKAVEAAQLVPAFPVKDVSLLKVSSTNAFYECILVKSGTTIREFSQLLHSDINKYFLYAEGIGGCRLKEDASITTTENNIVRYVTTFCSEKS